MCNKKEMTYNLIENDYQYLFFGGKERNNYTPNVSVVKKRST